MNTPEKQLQHQYVDSVKETLIAIIGYGYVGQAYHKVFRDALIYDPYNDKVESASREDINNADIAIISVPTPTSEDGMSCDTSAVESTLEWLQVPRVLIKSTVKIGTGERLQKKYPDIGIMFSPEFIGEGGYFIPFWKYPHPTDPIYHDFQIIGGDKQHTVPTAELFLRYVGPHLRVYLTDIRTAEVIKYTENMWIATKVTFVNEMYEACKALGVDWVDVREGWLMDSRVERMFTAVFTDKRGYQGKCLPKDTKALVHSINEAGYDPKFLRAVLDSNNRIRLINGFEEV